MLLHACLPFQITVRLSLLDRCKSIYAVAEKEDQEVEGGDRHHEMKALFTCFAT